MTNASYAPKARAHLKSHEHTENQLLLARVHNVGTKFVEALQELPREKLMDLLTLQDEEFWAELRNQAQLQTLINAQTPEKQEQEERAEARELFLKSLEKSGGVHKSSTAIKILATTVPTLIKKGNRSEVIFLKWGAENLYPVFQFCTSEENSENGMLAGVPELLSIMKHKVSAVRKCHFFTRKVDIPGTEKKVSIVEALRRGATPEEMAHFRILADNFGTNHTM
ncbi:MULTISPECIES: hypothetical protein [Enterobacter cloacae complex]|uniref:Uncharacterized protein n=1 Tax=Enterobacter genomosp. O TaxID=2364150 RepID=A0A0X4ESZ4_9ENTR|nr:MULTISPECIES: hypothetical protein [Enterobacter cloacae complex]KUQ84835.1 hypothetical protein AWI28_15220 [Enterobacter genomosp. O]KZP71761.1 hypothetical protein A3N36_20960 [Enterobacter hormaechei subsp. xiangfangensis]